jgi:O-antigen/teichoic acid export membrane protein
VTGSALEAGEAAPQSPLAAPPEPNRQASAARRIVTASYALGVATMLERGLGFTANFLAGRIGGAGVFGAYSLALTTANNIAGYAGGGIGSTATRFSGEHPKGTEAHGTLVRSLAVISMASALLATILLTAGAGPLARVLLHNPQLTNLLRWAALSAGAMVLLECCRGLFIGQREFPSLLLLSSLVGVGLVIGIPTMARISPEAMVMAQAGAVLLAVGVCGVVIFRRLPRSAERSAGSAGMGSMVRQIWRFGLVQLAGIVGLNAAGWWVASLVARADISLVEMGLFAAASQFRNMAAMAPGLLTQSSYGMLAERSRDGAPVHEHVLTLCSLGAGFSAVAIGGSLMLMLPWLLPLTYGASFRLGVLPASLALATAIVHMSSAPASARLTIRSLRAAGFINGLWAVLVVVLATEFISKGGAAAAMAIYLGTHLVSAVLVLAALRRSEPLPAGLVTMSAILFLTAVALALLAWWRASDSGLHGHRPDAALAGLTVFSLAAQFVLAQKHRWLPGRFQFEGLK